MPRIVERMVINFMRLIHRRRTARPQEAMAMWTCKSNCFEPYQKMQVPSM